MIKPTHEQEEWLREFYRMYSNYHLAVKLRISNKLLSKWLKDMGLKKKKDAKKSTLTDEDKQYIKDNFHSMTHEGIAVKLGVTSSAVRMYCFRNNLKKKGSEKFIPPPKKIIPSKAKEEKEFVRLKGEYSAGHQAIIDKYLNMDL